MRIMIAAACFPPNGWGGAEVAAEGIAQWLAKQGHAIAIYTDAALGPAPVPYRSHGQAWFSPTRSLLHRAHEHGRQGMPMKALWHALDHMSHRSETDFGQAAESFKPDIVMVHLAAGLGLGLFAYCAAHDIPVLFVVHDFWMTCIRSSMFSRDGAVCRRQEGLCRWSSERRLAALADIPRLGFWAPSRRIIEIIRDHVGDVFRNVLIERNVVNLSDFGCSAPRQTRETVVRFLYVGKVTEAKGVRFMLECLSSLSTQHAFEIDLVGSGDLETTLKQQFALDARFRFHGVQPRANVASLYHRASVLLVPSLWFENSPIVVYQAQAAGLPVVGSDSGGIPELLHGREDSLILPTGDRAAWITQLSALVSDPARLEKLQDAARRYASDNEKTLDTRGRRVEALCQSLIDDRE